MKKLLSIFIILATLSTSAATKSTLLTFKAGHYVSKDGKRSKKHKNITIVTKGDFITVKSSNGMYHKIKSEDKLKDKGKYLLLNGKENGKNIRVTFEKNFKKDVYKKVKIEFLKSGKVLFISNHISTSKKGKTVKH